MPGLIETLEAVQYERLAHGRLVEEVYLKPFKVCLLSLSKTDCHPFQQTLADNLSKYSDMVETTLDLASLDTHTHTIKPAYDEGLQRLANKLMEVSRLGISCS